MNNTRLLLAGGAVAVTLVAIWHRNTVKRERQRAVSDHRAATEARKKKEEAA